MRRVFTLCLAAAVCLAGNSLVAQKGGKPKPTTQPATAWFRCNGPNPPDGPSPCGAESFVRSDSITGDGSAYVGTGDLSTGSGAFLRYDGEFVPELRPLGGRFAYLDFRHVFAPPTGFHRKTFAQATLEQFHFNTNILDPNGQESDGGLTGLLPGERRQARIRRTGLTSTASATRFVSMRQRIRRRQMSPSRGTARRSGRSKLLNGMSPSLFPRPRVRKGNQQGRPTRAFTICRSGSRSRSHRRRCPF